MDEKEKVTKLETEISGERDKLSTDRLDISFGELINLYKNNELIIRPEYQRLFRWTPKQKTALIESLLLAIPIPPIFVAEDKEGVWELVDGLQRVSTFISFFGELNADVSKWPYQVTDTENEDEEDKEFIIGNKWKLEAGGLVENLEGFDIDTLPSKYKINLKRAVCRVEILRGESNTSMKYELFKRLNSGGSQLTAQEIRNAIYRQINPAINDLILELSENQSFQKLTQLSSQKKRKLYDHELILRFVAFLNNSETINENTENFLNSFMDKSITKGDFDISNYRDIFNKVIKMIADIGDEKVFKTTGNNFVPSYFEGITIGLAQNIEHYLKNSELLKSKINELKNDTEFRRVSGVGSSSKSRIKARLKRANEIFSSISNG